MPNATLCAKAVVEMVLAAKEEEGALHEVQNHLVAAGNLPRAYLISKDRLERCKGIESVEVQDRKGRVGVWSIDRMVQAARMD